VRIPPARYHGDAPVARLLKIFFHDACFDGTTSAALFSAYYRDAVDRAVDLLRDDEALLVTGSTYVAGAARTALRARGFRASG